jgi:5-methylcytosine-specific restriction protein A
MIEESVEGLIERKATGVGGRRSTISTYYSRNADVVKITRARARGICQLCGQPAPFKDSKKNPYLEVHHVVWLSRGGEDSTDNTVALCPNCHARMHVVEDEADMKKLMTVLQNCSR